MPALVKSSVGSSPGSRGLLGTTRWPCFSKYFRKEAANFPRMHLSIVSASGSALLPGGACEDRRRGSKPCARPGLRIDAGAALVVEVLRRLASQAALERAIEQARLHRPPRTPPARRRSAMSPSMPAWRIFWSTRGAAAMLDGAFHPRAARGRRGDRSRVPSAFKRDNGGVDVVGIELPPFQARRGAALPTARAPKERQRSDVAHQPWQPVPVRTRQ